MPTRPSPPMDARQRVKRMVERGLLLSGIPQLARWRRAGEVLVLAYHDIVPRGERPVGDRSLHLPQDEFAAQLDLLRETHEVISLDAALSAEARHGERASVVITFDDAYDGAVTAGVAELAARGLPATIFVAPGLLDGAEFWWDVLTPAGAPGLDGDVRDHALTAQAGRGTTILADIPPAARAAIPAFARGASLAALCRAAATPGITLGSHTWSHPNLAALPPDELLAELARPLAWLRESFDVAVPYLSYPYGLSSPAVERVAAQVGYRAAFRIDGGWLPREPSHRYALPRLNVPAGLSPEGFRLRSAGLLA
jgi:peptidoglycan/xylan/chitin deacetylase (PgdA/CDA1 family)